MRTIHGAVAALCGTILMAGSMTAMADSTDEIVSALVNKGILTEEEGQQLLQGHEQEQKSQKSGGRLTISEFIDNATVYGDIRVRGERRDGENAAGADGTRDRARYKLTFGIKTKANDFYTDLALAMGAGGRSDNATFAGDSNFNSLNDKESLFVKRAMIGWNVTDWLNLEAGRINNPLYTTSMVWDGDLTFEGLAEKAKFKVGNADVFLTAAQSSYIGDHKRYDGSGDRSTAELLAFQAGARFPVTDAVSAKAAITYTTYLHDQNRNTGVFSPASDTASAATAAARSIGINDLDTIEVPFEVNWMAASTIGFRVFGDYVNNLSGNDRADAACAVDATVCGAGSDHDGWMLGIGIGSAKDLAAFESNKMKKGDWNAKLWYQNVGAYAVDANAVDSDFFDSRVNMEGIVLKTQYNVRDNVFVNFSAGHGERKDGRLGTAGAGDLPFNLEKYNLYQLDLTYAF